MNPDGLSTPSNPFQAVNTMTGRPRSLESRSRQRELLRLLSEGHDLADAARVARVKAETVLRLLAEPEFRQAAFALVEAA